MHALAAGFLRVLVKDIDGLGQLLQALVQVPQFMDVALAFEQRLLLASHAFEQLLQVDGLLVVIGEPFPQGADDVLLLGLSGQHDRFEHALATGEFLERMDHLDAIDLGRCRSHRTKPI